MCGALRDGFRPYNMHSGNVNILHYTIVVQNGEYALRHIRSLDSRIDPIRQHRPVHTDHLTSHLPGKLLCYHTMTSCSWLLWWSKYRDVSWLWLTTWFEHMLEGHR